MLLTVHDDFKEHILQEQNGEPCIMAEDMQEKMKLWVSQRSLETPEEVGGRAQYTWWPSPIALSTAEILKLLEPATRERNKQHYSVFMYRLMLKQKQAVFAKGLFTFDT